MAHTKNEEERKSLSAVEWQMQCALVVFSSPSVVHTLHQCDKKVVGQNEFALLQALHDLKVASVVAGTMSVKQTCLSGEEGNKVTLDDVLEKFADLCPISVLILLVIDFREPQADGVMFCLFEVATMDTVKELIPW